MERLGPSTHGVRLVYLLSVFAADGDIFSTQLMAAMFTYVISAEDVRRGGLGKSVTDTRTSVLLYRYNKIEYLTKFLVAKKLSLW